MRAAALLLVVTGCAHDPDVCWFGTERSAGGVCALPELQATIDGDGAEWRDSGVHLFRSCFACPAGDVDHYQLARDGEEALLLYAVTNGPPVTDGSTDYIVSFRAVGDEEFGELRNFGFQVLIVGDQIVGRMLPWYEFTGLPVELAWTADGYEVRIPIALLPFEGGAWFGTGAADGTSDGSITRACWSPSAGDDVCAVNHD